MMCSSSAVLFRRLHAWTFIIVKLRSSVLHCHVVLLSVASARCALMRQWFSSSQTNASLSMKIPSCLSRTFAPLSFSCLALPTVSYAFAKSHGYSHLITNSRCPLVSCSSQINSSFCCSEKT